MHRIDWVRLDRRGLILVGALEIIQLNQIAQAQVETLSERSVLQQQSPSANPGPATKPTLAPSEPTAAVQSDWSAEADDHRANQSSQLGYKVLLHGPVHEAFAAPVGIDLKLGDRVYTEAPPLPIDEKPPASELTAQGAVWIAGYWAWSDESNRYIWISGLYRKPPPGRRWQAGYWTKSAAGYHWTSGYWSQSQAAEVVEALPFFTERSPQTTGCSELHIRG